MKKNILSLAVASGVAGLAVSAQAAMYVNPEGTGEVLLFPYYNAQNGNETSMHIVNTTGDAKAVKVRFMEYVNSQEVLDFNLYLSEYDHFSFTIFADPNGDGAAIVTRDNSCTVPALGAAGGTYPGYTEENADGSITRVQPFLPYQYADDEYNAVQRTMAGHVEVIEMGVLDDEDNDNDADTTEFTPESWATHGSDGVPADCGALVTAWSTGGTWLDDEDTEVEAPSGGLYGLANILNGSDASAYGMEAAAIADFWPTGTASEHTNPGDVLPSLASGDDDALVPNNGNFYTLAFAEEVDAVSALFMAESISNDVMVNADLNGETDWVVTFPTRRYYVNGEDALLPFTDLYDPDSAPNNSCESVIITQIDREESQTDPLINGPIFSPAPPAGEDTPLPELCYETNTIAVNGVSAMNTTVSSTDNVNVAVSVAANAGDEGWQTISFMGTGAAGADEHYMEATTAQVGGEDTDNGTRINGLPVIGFAAFEYTAGANNYGFVSDHKSSVGGSALGD